MFKIGEFARLSRISVRMLRHYDREGLLVPAAIDPVNGYRFYSSVQLKRANRITTLRDMGFGVDEIKQMVDLDADSFGTHLESRKAAIARDIEESRTKLERLDALKDALVRGCDDIQYEVAIKSVPAFDVISLTMTLPSYEDERLAWERLGAYMKSHAVSASEPYTEFCEIHAEGEDGEGVTLEVAVAVDASAFTHDDPPFRFYRTEAFDQVASIMVYGPYENIAPIYASFARWLDEHPTLRMAGNTREIAHVGYWNADDPAEYLTEFQIPVAPKA